MYPVVWCFPLRTPFFGSTAVVYASFSAPLIHSVKCYSALRSPIRQVRGMPCILLKVLYFNRHTTRHGYYALGATPFSFEGHHRALIPVYPQLTEVWRRRHVLFNACVSLSFVTGTSQPNTNVRSPTDNPLHAEECARFRLVDSMRAHLLLDSCSNLTPCYS